MKTVEDSEISELLELGIIKELIGSETPARGQIVRRINRSKDQQGLFTGQDDSGGLILSDVFDISTMEFLAEQGVIRSEKGDRLFCYTSTFVKNKKSQDAYEILNTWPVYKKNPDLHKEMDSFFRSVFSPEHVLYLKKNDRLDTVFIPLQKKLKIGRYVENINWEAVRKEKFHEQLEALKPGEHITYVALIPQTSTYTPKFYSIGTKPHEETQMSLNRENFNFKPTHGGHIKADRNGEGIIYYVDAGSNFLGKGMKTKLETAESVVKALRREHKGYRFIPLEGRGAFGTEQSY